MNSVGRGISRRGLAQNIITRLQSSVSSSASQSSTYEIQIPPKIERGPTDILRALEKTIKRDPTAPHYKFHDDPFLIPYSNYAKHTYALSQEAGRRAAMWVREQHAATFQQRMADPLIESYLAKPVYTTKDQVSEDILKKTINEVQLDDARHIYELLEGDVSVETKLSLFEMLCYYNNEKPIDPDFLSEKWLRQNASNSFWLPCNLTSTLFGFLKAQEDPSIVARAYSAQICGYTKFIKADHAWMLFEEAEKNNIPLSLSAYNGIISILGAIKDKISDRVTLLKEVLQKMVNAGVCPNVRTLNSALMISSYTASAPATSLCRSLFAEFKYLGVEPSLGSFHYALNIFYKKKDSVKTQLLEEILCELEARTELRIEDKADINFFVTAMDIAANYLEDTALADRVHKLLLTGDNYNFIGSGHMENIYYRHFLTLQVKNNSLDEFMSSYYDILVPHVYTPETSVMDAIFSAVIANDPEIGLPLMPRLWTHLVQFNQLQRKNIVGKALNIMRVHCKPPEASPLNETFGEAAWAVWTFVTEKSEQRQEKLSWDGPILGDVAVLCLRAKKFQRVDQVITFLFGNQSDVVGTLLAEQITELLDTAILNFDVSVALNLVHYCSDIGLEETPTMAYKIWRNLSLNEWQYNRLVSLVGADILKEPKDN